MPAGAEGERVLIRSADLRLGFDNINDAMSHLPKTQDNEKKKKVYYKWLIPLLLLFFFSMAAVFSHLFSCCLQRKPSTNFVSFLDLECSIQFKSSAIIK